MPLRYILIFLQNLSFTVFFETVTLFFLLRYFYRIKKGEINDVSIVAAGIFASSLTLPYVSFVIPSFFFGDLYMGVAINGVIAGELFAVVVEAVFYRFFFKLSMRRAFLLSFVCNAVSFILGLLLLF